MSTLSGRLTAGPRRSLLARLAEAWRDYRSRNRSASQDRVRNSREGSVLEAMTAGRGRNRRQRAAAMPAVRYATSPLLASPTPAWRSRLVIVLLALGSTVLVAKAAWVQLINAGFYEKEGADRYQRKLELPARRGRVLDRNGLILASSVPTPSVWAIPKEMEASRAQQAELARLLGMKPADLKRRLEQNPNFVWLRRQVGDDVWQQVAALKIKGIYQLKEYQRQYPEGEAAAHVVGFTNVEDRGQEGIELAFQNELAGVKGERRVIRDGKGRIVQDIGDGTAPTDGRDLELSIDSRIQFFAYQRIRDAVAAHRARAGSVVVLDARSGEVLALANVPTYTPANRRNLSGAQLRNRALTDIFEPGSTMKPFVVARALQTRRVRPDTPIDTHGGVLRMAGATINDAHPHGTLTVAQIIQKSSNVGTVKLAMQMPPREMWELYAAIGLGQRPHLPFPGAANGKLRPYKTWKPVEQATMSYGYGLSASLFQLAHAYTVFANDGELMPVSLVRRSEPLAPGSGLRVFSPEVARQMRQMLHLATQEGGTAPKAYAVGYSVGGKTGTARKQEGKGYADKKYRAWFVGLAPVSQPRIVVAVMVDEPSAGKFYGGEVAAPVFAEVVQQTLTTLGVSPDIPIEPRIVVQAEEESF